MKTIWTNSVAPAALATALMLGANPAMAQVSYYTAATENKYNDA